MDRFWKYKLDHVIFWTATVGFHMFTQADMISEAGFDQFVLEIIIRNGLLAMLIYFNLLVVIPRFAQQKNLITNSILVFLSLGCYALLKNAHDVYLNGYVLGEESRQHYFYSTYYNFSIALFYFAFSVALHLSKEWYFQQELIRKMEFEKLNAELEYLKAQINPHFVFNSINTIYFQIDKHNVAAREALSAFSEILRYQLYECNDKQIVIEKEINYLKNYVELQRMRKDKNYDISFDEKDALKGFTIAPLLLIPFVENAFKHVSHHQGKNEIRIQISRHENQFNLSVFNTKERNGTINEHAGIGLKNVKRRLELLYKDQHQLEVHNSPESFEVNLALKIKP
ncbi:MAG: histidine kinase [Chryseosolibacter sp.]